VKSNDTIASRRIFLIGYMGSGKTTRGRALAGLLNLPFVDLDEWVAGSTRRSLVDWFTHSGEEAFRLAESDALREWCDSGAYGVMATGGGTPMHHDNMKLMQESGTTVYLQVHEQELVRRLAADNASRPLLSGLDGRELDSFVRAHLHSRESRYLESHRIWREEESPEDFAKQLSLHSTSAH